MSLDALELRRHPVLADPAALARSLGIAARPQPNGVVVCCPAHEDQHPSCSITLGGDGTARCRCHACGFTGDALTLIAQSEGLDVRGDFPTVLERARQLAGAAAPSTPPSARRSKPDEAERLSAFEFDRLATFLGERGNDPAVCAWLAARHVIDGIGGDVFPVTAATAAELWRHVDAHAEPVTREALEASGLFRDGRLSHARNVLAIAWRDPHGRIDTLQRRRLDDGRPKYVFPASRAPRWPFGIERLRSGAAVVLVEGALDAMARRELDRLADLDRDVLGVPGASSWAPAWGSYLEGREVIVASDADDAGDRAARSWADAAWRAGARRVTRLRPCGANDWSDVLARAVTEERSAVA
jgi:DNA primase